MSRVRNSVATCLEDCRWHYRRNKIALTHSLACLRRVGAYEDDDDIIDVICSVLQPFPGIFSPITTPSNQIHLDFVLNTLFSLQGV
jgi:hypothetical protein